MNTTSTQRRDALYPEHILKEAAAIREARANRIQQLLSLGLRVPDEAVALVTARSRAAVDLVRRRGDSAQLLREAINRCNKRAARAA